MVKDFLLLSSALIIPYIPGYQLASIMIGSRSHIAYRIGASHLYGFLFVAAVMYGCELFLGHVSIPVVLAVSFLVCLVLYFWPVPSAGGVSSTVRRCRRSAEWWTSVFFLFLALLHFLPIILEASLRPIYAWDAWSSWFPKTLQYYHEGSIKSAVSTMKGQAHPPTINLIELWMIKWTGLGSLGFQMLWPLTMLSMCLVVFGWLRDNGASLLLASVSIYLFASLPYAGVHASLAGYADIWLAAAVLLTITFVSSMTNTVAGLTKLCVNLLCIASIKFSGLLFMSSVLAYYLMRVLRHSLQGFKVGYIRSLLVLAGLGSILILALLFSSAPDSYLDRIVRDTGVLSISWGIVQQEAARAMLEALLSMYWSMLWPFFLFMICVFAWRGGDGRVGGINFMVVMSLLLVSCYYLFVAPNSAIDQTGFSRSLLPIAAPALLSISLVIDGLVQSLRKAPSGI